MITLATEKKTIQTASAVSFGAAHNGLLQRSCACGQHTVAGGGCSECDKKKSLVQRKEWGRESAGSAHRSADLNAFASPNALNKRYFDYDFSRVKVSARRPAPTALQMKLAVNDPGDVFEQEADRVAEEVTRKRPEHSEKEPLRAIGLHVQRRPANRTAGLAEAPPIVSDVLQATGQPLDAATRAFMEPRFGHDFSKVRVHTDTRADAATRSVNARAFTSGHNLVFRSGEYNPQSEQGRNLLAHELTHTLQQDESGVLHRKPLTAEEKEEDLQSERLKDDARLQKAFDHSPVLKKNETSEGVKTLQRALRDLDYQLPISFEKSGDADGIFGDETEGQVKKFQRDNHITDDGEVGRATLRALDEKFNPNVIIEKVFFGQDHRDLVNNETDWSATGAKYVDWANAPFHILFKPEELIADTIPISVTAGQTIGALARVKVRGGIPGRTYTVKARPLGLATGWTLTGEGTHQQGVDEDLIFLSAEAPIVDKIGFRDFILEWQTETSAGLKSQSISGHKVFITSGAAHDTTKTDRGDAPHVPTFKRLKEATRLANGVNVSQADDIVFRVIQNFPGYGVCDIPTVPNNFGKTCPVMASVWEMSDMRGSGDFQCITIARYSSAVINTLGVPKTLENITVKPVIIWANQAKKEEGIEDDANHPGLNIPSIRHPLHPEWALGLIDGRCGINNFEACVKLQWKPPGSVDEVTQYYCGGVTNPPKGFKTPREVLNKAFVLSFHVPMSKPDPVTRFPRGVRKEDVKVYNNNVGCFRDLGQP